MPNNHRRTPSPQVRTAPAREAAPPVALPNFVEAALQARTAAAEETRLRESVDRAVRAALSGADWDKAVAEACAPPRPLHEMSTDELRRYAASPQGRLFRNGRAVGEADSAPPLHQMGYDARHAHSATAWAARTQGHGSPFWRDFGQPDAPSSDATA